MYRLVGALGTIALAGCTTGPTGAPVAMPRPSIATTASLPPSGDAAVAPAAQSASAPNAVLGAQAGQLTRLFGAARIDLLEGDARKLQFANEQCVLDIFLYPLKPGEAPIATHIETRRPQDGEAVDDSACIAALKR